MQLFLRVSQYYILRGNVPFPRAGHILLVQCITLLRASAAAWNVRVMKFTCIAKLLLRVFRIT